MSALDFKSLPIKKQQLKDGVAEQWSCGMTLKVSVSLDPCSIPQYRDEWIENMENKLREKLKEKVYSKELVNAIRELAQIAMINTKVYGLEFDRAENLYIQILREIGESFPEKWAEQQRKLYEEKK